MPERPDLRQIAATLRESLEGLDRDALVELLTYVLNEYVVEGPPPLSALQVEKLEDLAGLSLAGLVGSLQTRLDVPGLELLRVEGEQVHVHTANGWLPLQPLRPAPRDASAAGLPEPRPAAEPSVQGRAGVRFVEQPPARAAPRPPAAQPTGRAAADEALERGRGDLIGGERGVIVPPAPRPAGLTISGRPSAEPPAQPGAQPPQPPPSGEPPSGPPSSSERKEDDAAIRFSLLELD